MAALLRLTAPLDSAGGFGTADASNAAALSVLLLVLYAGSGLAVATLDSGRAIWRASGQRRLASRLQLVLRPRTAEHADYRAWPRRLTEVGVSHLPTRWP